MIMGFVRSIKKINKQRRPLHHPHLDAEHEPLLASLALNLSKIRQTMGQSSDLIVREILLRQDPLVIQAAIVYMDGLADVKAVQDFILPSLMQHRHSLPSSLLQIADLINEIKQMSLTVANLREITDFTGLFESILSGGTVILLDGAAIGLAVNTEGWEDRNVEESTSQTVVRGPKEGFTENLRTNTALIRRRIKDPRLWLETRTMGQMTKTSVALMYIRELANEKVIEEVRIRLDRVRIDGILESGYVEELIQDETFTPFPTVFNSERPDAVAGGLLEGRIAILVDGTPFVLLVPALFTQFFQSPEDYYQRADISTLIRMLRFFSFFIALLGPSLYIAITTFHQQMIPTTLLISLAAQREGIPFPAFVEAFMMELTFEILREAGTRMPRNVGQALSIVGALVIGQSAVEAGIISAAMVIVVSITAIASFVLPSYNFAISVRILRFLFMGLAASFGLFGIMLGMLAMVLHLSSLRSFGVPYLSPFAPLNYMGQKDSMFRFPHWSLLTRPRLISQINVIREETPPAQKPNRRET
jgi:spore germination protein KA